MPACSDSRTRSGPGGNSLKIEWWSPGESRSEEGGEPVGRDGHTKLCRPKAQVLASTPRSPGLISISGSTVGTGGPGTRSSDRRPGRIGRSGRSPDRQSRSSEPVYAGVSKARILKTTEPSEVQRSVSIKNYSRNSYENRTLDLHLGLGASAFPDFSRPAPVKI
jgi:hypothetical protein